MRAWTLISAAFLTVGSIAMPSSAALLAYDSFNYTTLNNTTPAGGSGFGGTWSVRNGGDGAASDVVIAGMTYAGLPTANGAATAGNATRSIESLASAVSSGTVWVSALVKGGGNSGGDAAGLILAGTTNGVFAGFGAGNSATHTGFGLGTASGTAWVGGPSNFTSAANISNTAVHLVVVKIDLSANSVELYLNPTAGQPVAPSPNLTKSITVGSLTGVGFNSINPNVSVDEFRVGTTFADVVGVTSEPAVPEPATLGLLGVGALGLLARRRKA